MKIDVGVLGATGMVGQRFVSLLADHPWFEPRFLTASSRSAGKPYVDAVNWFLDEEIPESVREVDVRETKADFPADLVFSALPSSVASHVEPEFANEGYIVASNASSYRMDSGIPLRIPEVNPNHLDLINSQKRSKKHGGAIITNPNCSTIILAMSIAPLYKRYGIKEIKVATLQAVSGAGYSGVPSMAIIDNVIPYISGEEEKMENETLKILGQIVGSEVDQAEIEISAQCNRVPVIDGHTENVWVKLENNSTINEIKEVMENFRGEPQKLELPSAPKKPIHVLDERDRPQPRIDRGRNKGMSISIGRLKKGKSDGELTFTVLGHNTLRGAAGASILNAELLVEKGYM